MNFRTSLSVVTVVTFITVPLLLPFFAFASTFKANDTVSITNQDDITDNVYVAGGIVSVNTPIGGDLFVAGGNILVTEPIAKDIVAAGGSITILGDVGDDVRAAGGNIVITGDIAGELVAAGGSVTVTNGTTVTKDVVIVGGQVTLDGVVVGDVKVTGGVATINGRVEGNVIAELQDTLTIGENAVVGGNIVYTATEAEALSVSDGATVMGEVVFESISTSQPVDTENVVLAAVGIFVLFKLIVMLVTALILVWLFKNFSTTIVRTAITDPLRMLGYGFVTLVVTPVAAVLLFVTLLGIPLAIATLLAFGLIVLLTSLYSGVVVGAWANNFIHTGNVVSVNWKTVILGIVLLTLITLIPIMGWIVGFIVFLITLGSLTHLIRQKLWQAR